MQAGAEAMRRAGQRGHEIDDLGTARIQQAWFDPSRGFVRHRRLPISDFRRGMIT
jgi:hypothetical protein